MSTITRNRLRGTRSSLAYKAPCKVATTANITLSGAQTIDGVSVVTDDRVLVKDQTTASENGIWVVNSLGAWERAQDFESPADVTQGTRVDVVQGSTNVGEWRLTTSGDIVIGTTSVAFAATSIATADIADGAVTAAKVNGDIPVSVADRTALKALDTSQHTTAYLEESGREGLFVFRSGDYASNVTADSQEGIYIAATDTASSSGAWVRAYVGAPLVTWFGVAGDGTTDDGPALQVAANVSDALAFPTGSYLIRTQVVLDDTHDPRSWVGLGGTIPASKTGPGPRFVYHSDLGANPMIVNECTTWFSNLAFDGTAKGTGIAIRNRRDTASGAIYEDTDTSFVGCHFSDWDLGIQHYNRGLLVQNCSFQLHDVSIELFWDDANFVDDAGNVYDDVDQGFRAIRIENNRFHANTINIQNIGTDADKLRGFSCIGNQIDIGDMLFYGGMQSGLFAGNVVDQSSAAAAAIRITTACERVTITGNLIVGDTEQGEPGALIQFDSTVAHAVITGNVLERATQYGIVFAGAVSETAISGNSFSEIGTSGNTTRACIRFLSTATNVTITSNAFAPRTDAYCVRGTTGSAWTAVVINGNAWDRTKLLAGIYTDAGSNYIQSTFGGPAATPAAATTIADATDVLNTSGKAQGALAFDTTNNRLMVAAGSSATALWYVADGSTSVTPST